MKQEEEILRVMEASPGRDDVQAAPRRRWVVTIVAATDGSAGGHGEARVALRRVPRCPEKIRERSEGGEAAGAATCSSGRQLLPEKKKKMAR